MVERIGTSATQAEAIGRVLSGRLGCTVVGWGGGSGQGSQTWAGSGARSPSLQVLDLSGVGMTAWRGPRPWPDDTPVPTIEAEARAAPRG